MAADGLTKTGRFLGWKGLTRDADTVSDRRSQNLASRRGFLLANKETQVPRALADIRTLARRHTSLAINTLAGIARQKSAPPAARVSASVALLERGWGKAAAEMRLEGDVRVTIRKIIDDDSDGGAPMIDVTPENLVSSS